MHVLFVLFVLLLLPLSVKANDIFTNQFETLITTRLSSLELRDPHIFADLDFFGCSDVTDTTPIGDGVNPIINQSFSDDGDGDGLLDFSLITRYNTDQPNYLVDRPTVATLSEADCDLTLTCEVSVGATQTIFDTQVLESGTCLDVIPGSTSGYLPAVIVPQGPCHVTDTKSVSLDLSGIIITLNDYQQALRYSGGITTDQGLHRGFLDEATAESTLLPNNLPVVGGNTLASILSGHSTNCSTNSDMDTHPTLGDGWWMYFNSASDLVELSTD